VISPYTAFCYPAGSVVNNIRWNWKTTAVSATSYDDMMTRTPSFTYQTQGDGMFYHDTAAGYVWVRVLHQLAQIAFNQSPP